MDSFYFFCAWVLSIIVSLKFISLRSEAFQNNIAPDAFTLKVKRFIRRNGGFFYRGTVTERVKVLGVIPVKRRIIFDITGFPPFHDIYRKDFESLNEVVSTFERAVSRQIENRQEYIQNRIIEVETINHKSNKYHGH